MLITAREAKDGMGAEYSRNRHGARHWVCYPRDSRSPQVGLRGSSQWVKGDTLQHPSSHVEQRLQPEFRWVYTAPRCAPGE
jgi:hypothetical protein